MAPNIGLMNLTPGVKGAIVDIVFIHGLRGDAEGTLTWTGDKRNHVFWPKDLLPEDVKNARILTWGYDSKFGKFWTESSNKDIDSYSNNLCSDLKGLRSTTSTTDRPIIFVTHSLGGLVCKNALLLASRHVDADVRTIADKTYGIIFLGTPHEGSDMAKWAGIGLQFFRLDSSTNATRNLDVLKKESVKLYEVSYNFKMFLRGRNESKEPDRKKIDIVCFYEEKRLTIGKVDIGWVVPKESAVLEAFKIVSIPANHMEMARFENKNDVGYKRVVGELDAWMTSLASLVQPHNQGVTVTFNGNIMGNPVGNINGSPTIESKYNFNEGIAAKFFGL